MIDILLWIILGAIAGWIASKIMNTDAEMGAMANIVVGILGALIGGFVVQVVTGADTTTGFNFTTLLTAIVGAVILLAIVKAFRRGGSTHRA